MGCTTQPTAGSQTFAKHSLEAPQFLGEPPPQLPPEQLSPMVQALPSSQGPLVGACAQAPVEGSHESPVQTLPSSQLIGVPVQLPPLHASPVVQAFPSSHDPLIGE